MKRSKFEASVSLDATGRDERLKVAPVFFAKGEKSSGAAAKEAAL
jgi:hypothetical protein